MGRRQPIYRRSFYTQHDRLNYRWFSGSAASGGLALSQQRLVSTSELRVKFLEILFVVVVMVAVTSQPRRLNKSRRGGCFLCSPCTRACRRNEFKTSNCGLGPHKSFGIVSLTSCIPLPVSLLFVSGRFTK